mmetsp:Transcript_15807/g.47536  ORF Transcript_15807/g.47536 Transcript_15807/m.47536 type:complete len:108 (-) Transcript_15807:1512-1835(-)
MRAGRLQWASGPADLFMPHELYSSCRPFDLRALHCISLAIPLWGLLGHCWPPSHATLTFLTDAVLLLAHRRHVQGSSTSSTSTRTHSELSSSTGAIDSDPVFAIGLT